jgi:ribonuclease HI
MSTSNIIQIFTDGSYVKKTNYCGYGVLFPNAEFKNMSRKFTHEPLTNQRAELYAIYKAIKVVNKKNNQSNIDKSFIKSILDIHSEVKKQNDKLNKLRKFTMMAHKDLENKLEKILNF